MQKTTALLALVAAAALAVAGCGGSSDSSGSATAASGSTSSGSGSTKLALVAYSTPQAAYDKIIPAFGATAAGKGTSFSESFGASGDQSRAVLAGQPADVVAFSLAPDVSKLVKAGLVDASWNQDAYKGVVTDSVVALVVRKGNPKGIKDWADLVKPGVQVITPNPFTSGSAKWNIMAAYGAQIQAGKSPAAALAYLKTLFTKHVAVQDKSGRDALNTFAGGKGDVLISYENEAIGAQQKGIKVDYVIPKNTILIENPIAVVSKTSHPAQAKAFVQYTRSPTAQRIFGKLGYRPIVPAIAKEFSFPTPPGLFTIAKFGGWSTVNKQFFDPATGSVAKVEQAAGVSTGG
ncbi:MAG: sulfate transporter, periplasmic sulfate-binding protein [Solirubrobacterales bacterium]|nr:sulfate transporter, periplasmic sulfate-binding protein [Solirubrobacterales bacterium]